MDHCMKVMQELDISVVAFFIIGFPGETVQHVFNSFNLALKYPIICQAYFFNPNPLPETELYNFVVDNNMLRATDEQICDNIGGMGEDALIETPELPLRERKILLQMAKDVSRLVELQHMIYKSNMGYFQIENISAADKARKSIQASIARHIEMLSNSFKNGRTAY